MNVKFMGGLKKYGIRSSSRRDEITVEIPPILDRQSRKRNEIIRLNIPWENTKTTLTCCRMACAIAGTNEIGLRSRSSQRISANCSGVISCSVRFQVKQSRNFTPSNSMSNRMGTRCSGCWAFSWYATGSESSRQMGKLEILLLTLSKGEWMFKVIPTQPLQVAYKAHITLLDNE